MRMMEIDMSEPRKTMEFELLSSYALDGVKLDKEQWAAVIEYAEKLLKAAGAR